jgi:hypothetical protein
MIHEMLAKSGRGALSLFTQTESPVLTTDQSVNNGAVLVVAPELVPRGVKHVRHYLHQLNPKFLGQGVVDVNIWNVALTLS